MQYLVIIQARCGSSRLPGKVLMKLAGKTALEWVIERVSRSRYVDEVMVATTINHEDIPIVKLVSGLGLRVFCGSSDDVLDRYYQAAKLVMPEYVIRITSDCPLIDSELLDDAIEKMTPENDYCWAASETLADGLDIEILKFEALQRAWKEAKLQSEREHVTLYLKNHPEIFNTYDYICPFANLHDERWTLDEDRDFAFLERVFNELTTYKIDYFSAQYVYSWLNDHPEIREINRGIPRNEGLQISLQNDHLVG